MKSNKRAYTSNWARIEKQISPKQKERMDFSSIAVHVATCAYKKKCCSCNCILKLVEKYSINNVAKAVHLARKDVYHTNANHAHVELREVLKFGRCNSTFEVFAYFDHKKVFEDAPSRVKVRPRSVFFPLYEH
jgi:hypothetical protein